ncbi:hypothetical protein GJ689_19030 [Rhodoplanes serenus]|uniref:Uncharacterized protein n=1 Tax=Rhodoplanes serenus TaxID=200615 RepID=A0A9X4XRE6_9BRAD|nr:hypothetical protein [Rhodoplanes serenus]MTW18299.1 hypothetical protein [Rhodoplanes serenus]
MTTRDGEAEAGAGRPGCRTGPARRASVGLTLAGLVLIGTTMPLAAMPFAAPSARPDAGTAPLSGDRPTAATAPDGQSIDGDLVMVAASRRRPIPPWVFGRSAEPRLVPPRAIPGRPGPGARLGAAPGGASAKAAAPLPRTRPDRPGEPTGTVSSRSMPPPAPGAVTVPIAPLE